MSQTYEDFEERLDNHMDDECIMYFEFEMCQISAIDGFDDQDFTLLNIKDIT